MYTLSYIVEDLLLNELKRVRSLTSSLNSSLQLQH